MGFVIRPGYDLPNLPFLLFVKWVQQVLPRLWYVKYQVYQFPVAVVTNYQKMNGLKQHNFIIIQFLQSDPNCISLGQNQYVGRSAFFSGGSRGKSIVLPFLVSRGFQLQCQAMGPCCPQRQQGLVKSSSYPITQTPLVSSSST